MQETFYFGAGPATLPKAVLNIIKNDLVDYCGSGLSVLELSHRSDEFIGIVDQAENLLYELMGLSDDYAVLFLHGGATTQYSMLPLNFLHQGKTADYICTGYWSNKACQEAKIFADINTIEALIESEVVAIKPIDQWELQRQASYIHYCDNETISGVFNDLAGNENSTIREATLFCDMTSSILTRPIQVKDYGLIYASAQKNLGVAGLCVMVIKKELLNNVCKNIPIVFDYKKCFESSSLVNTPPTFAIYVLSLVLKWLKDEGGVVESYKRRQQQAKSLYDVIDNSGIYENKVAVQARSKVNISFEIKDRALQAKFLQHAENHKLLGLRGHSSAGGVRVSLYNAMPKQGVINLLEFMRDFESSRM
ncbi:MAG: 3-phosphoserine/phosphohydroxythreonine transaminase [Gammaproteobacteria bacterium]|nr:3-phosphoserine/phosphohydroxythreonine transaminase [Gammaproteobacteria bacterium]